MSEICSVLAGWETAGVILMDETIRICDAASGQEFNVFEGHSSCVNPIAFSPDDMLIVSDLVDPMVWLWDVAKGEICLLLDGHSGCVKSVRFSPSGKQIISASDDTTCRVRDTATGPESVALKEHLTKITAITFSPNAHLIASGSDHKAVRLRNAITRTLIVTLEASTLSHSPQVANFSHQGQFYDEVRSQDGMTGATVGALDNLDEPIKPLSHQLTTVGLDEDTVMVDDETFVVVKKEMKGHSSTFIYVIFSPDCKLVATGSHDTTIKLWAREGTERWKLEAYSGSISHLVSSPDSRIVASAWMDEIVKL